MVASMKFSIPSDSDPEKLIVMLHKQIAVFNSTPLQCNFIKIV